MAALPYIPIYVADYLADTAHLSAAEHGAYLLLIMNYWQRGKPLPAADDRLARIARMSNEEWAASKATLAEFFEEIDGEWTHARIERDLDGVKSKSDKARSAGKASAASRSNVRSTPVERPLNHTDTDTDTEEVTTPNASAARPDLSRLASQLEKAGGEAIDDPARSSGLLSLSEPLNWIDSGCDLDLDILPTLKARSAGRPPREIRTWGYFTKAVFQARDTRLRPSPEPSNEQHHHGQGQPASRPRSGADTFLAAVRAEAEQLDDRGFPDRRDTSADFGDGRTLDLRANEAA